MTTKEKAEKEAMVIAHELSTVISLTTREFELLQTALKRAYITGSSDCIKEVNAML